jgi:hypothetical protein
MPVEGRHTFTSGMRYRHAGIANLLPAGKQERRRTYLFDHCRLSEVGIDGDRP